MADGALRFTISGGANNSRGKVFTLTPSGHSRRLADLGAYEAGANPDGTIPYGFARIDAACKAQLPAEIGPPQYTGVVETHPYGTALVDGTTYVADAAANDILAIAPDGSVRVVAVIPRSRVKLTADSAAALGLPACTAGRTVFFEGVPTDVDMGPDGQLYVSTLAGGPESDVLGGTGGVLRIDPVTGKIAHITFGLVGATGVAVADNGDVYVSQLFRGEISKIPAHTRTAEPFASVPLPADVDAVGNDLYATINVLPGPGGPPDGQLVRISTP